MALQAGSGRRGTDIIEETGLGLEPLRPRPKLDATLTMPYIAHEHQWWTCLPKPETRPKYEGLPAKPDGVIALQQAAAQSGLANELPLLVENSQKLKHLIRKEGLEFVRKLSSAAGYHHWLIHDFNWCPEGVFNEFWEPPAGLSAEEFRAYNADTVLLIEDHRRRCFAFGDKLDVPILVSHYGPEPIGGAELTWTVKCSQRRLLSGTAEVPPLPCGTLRQIGEATGRLPQLERASELVIEASLRDSAGGMINRNRWKIWAFPQTRRDLHGRGVRTDLPFIRKAYAGTRPLDLEAYQPVKIAPVVRSIGHYKTMRNKAYMFEASIGRGALLATTFNIAKTFADHPETKYLVDVLIEYCLSDEFKPHDKVPTRLFRERVEAWRAGAASRPGSP